MKRFVMDFVFATLISLFTMSSLFGCGGKTNTITLQDNQALLTNPNMGWNFTYYANTIDDFNTVLQSGDYLDEFPCDIVFFRIGWNWIEPNEGEFNWDFTDKVANEWIEHGKRVAFCWVCTYPGDQSTPLWVKDAGAYGVDYSWQVNANGEYCLSATDGGIGTLKFSDIPLDAQEL